MVCRQFLGRSHNNGKLCIAFVDLPAKEVIIYRDLSDLNFLKFYVVIKLRRFVEAKYV